MNYDYIDGEDNWIYPNYFDLPRFSDSDVLEIETNSGKIHYYLAKIQI